MFLSCESVTDLSSWDQKCLQDQKSLSHIYKCLSVKLESVNLIVKIETLKLDRQALTYAWKQLLILQTFLISRRKTDIWIIRQMNTSSYTLILSSQLTALNLFTVFVCYDVLAIMKDYWCYNFLIIETCYYFQLFNNSQTN